jgi:hypothetical protein
MIIECKVSDEEIKHLYEEMFEMVGIIEGKKKMEEDEEDTRKGWESFPEVVNVRDKK